MTLPRRTLSFVTGAVSLVVVYACTDTPVGQSGDDLTSAVGTTTEAILTGAGNIARCGNDNDEATARLLDSIPGIVVALGDNAFPNGRLIDYQNCYHPTWGRHYERTRAVIGNHEYDSSETAQGAFDYFGTRAGPRPLGYYSFDLGDWHVVVLNDNASRVPFAAGSTQDQWLQNDLAANTKSCTIALWHVPLFLSTNTAGYTVNSSRRILWERLYAASADIVLNGAQHHYERMAPMRPDGTRDDESGIRQFNVGTGGDALAMPTGAIHPNSEVRGAVYGVLKLTLKTGAYSWEFVPVAGQSFTDSGSGTCAGGSTNTPPTAAFTSACQGLSCRFTDGSTDPDGTVSAWSWTFGDGGSSSAQNPGHTYAAAGTYTVGLTVTDNQGATNSTSRSITVTEENRAPTAAFAAACTGLRCSFTDGSTDADGTIVSWSWTFGDGGTSTERNPQHTYAAAGAYTVELTVTDDEGATDSASKSVAVTAENRAPSADFTASCVDLTCDFTDGSTDPDGTVTAWSWTFGDGATSTEPSPRHTYAAGGTYTVGLTVTDDDGATGSTSRSVTVTAPPPPNALPTAAFTASCENLSCTFTDQSTDSDGRVTAWSWDFGDGESSSNQNPSHTYGDGGTYTVRLTVTDDRGGTGSASRSVTLNRRPVADPGGPYRSQDVVRFDGSGSADPDRDALTYAWDFGDGATGTGVAPTHTYTKDGKYTVTLVVTDADGARSAPATTTATIANEPPRVNAGPDVTMIPGIFTLRARFEDPGVDDGPFSYEITWGDGLSSSGSVASDSDEIVVGHPYLLPGTYQVRVLVRDSHGAVGQDEVIVTVTLL